jgi:hypothetical protein
MDLAWFREVLKGHGDADPDDDEDVYGFHIPHKGQKKKTHVKHKSKSKFHGEELKNAIVNGVFDSNPFGNDHHAEHKSYKPPLHEAIRYFAQLEGNPEHLEPGSAGYMGEALPAQIEHCSGFLADISFRHAERYWEAYSTGHWDMKHSQSQGDSPDSHQSKSVIAHQQSTLSCSIEQYSMDPKKSRLRRQRETWRIRAEALLKHPKLHSMNVHEHLQDARKIVENLVKLERLPQRNNIEGLRLIRQAWDDYDRTWYLASRYKILAKVTFFLQIVLGLLTIAATVTHMQFEQTAVQAEFCKEFVSLASCASLLTEAQKDKLKTCKELGHSKPIKNVTITEDSDFLTELKAQFGDYLPFLDDAVFLLPIMSAFVLTIFAFLNPQARWRNLRNCACTLESMTWLYRTRVEPFTVNLSYKNSPEDQLMQSLNEWRDNLVEGSDLNLTTVEESHAKNSHVWRHYQYSGKLGDPVGTWYGRTGDWAWKQLLQLLECKCVNFDVVGTFCFCCRRKEERKQKVTQHPAVHDVTKDEQESAKRDDYFSPCKPNAYIKLRLLRQKTFYQNRVPGYVRQRWFLHVAAVVCTTCGAIFGYYGLQGAVAALSALAGAFTSWSEFCDVGRKLERYSNSIRSIKKLLAWWESLSDVDQSSVPNITRLVLDGEQIIMGELGGWGAQRREKKEGQNEEEAGNNAKGAGNKTPASNK